MQLAAELRAMHVHAYHIHPPGLLLPVGRYPHLLTREMIMHVWWERDYESYTDVKTLPGRLGNFTVWIFKARH